MRQTKDLLQMLLCVFILLEATFVIHEYGHLRELQKQDIPVKEFSLGVGPLVYQYQTDSSLAISFRFIPIMAYIEPTEDGKNILKQKGFLDKLMVYSAGVRNNLLVSVLIVLFLQVLGWRRGNISGQELSKIVIITPFKILLRFFAFVVGCVTLTRVNMVEKFLLSTGCIVPSVPINVFIVFNLIMCFVNLMPISPFDGRHILESILLATGTNIHMPDIPEFVGIMFFATFYAIFCGQDMRVLEVDQ